MIKKEELTDYSIGSEDLVSLKTMGHIYEICYLQKKNNKITTQLLDKDHLIIPALIFYGLSMGTISMVIIPLFRAV